MCRFNLIFTVSVGTDSKEQTDSSVYLGIRLWCGVPVVPQICENIVWVDDAIINKNKKLNISVLRFRLEFLLQIQFVWYAHMYKVTIVFRGHGFYDC